MLQDSLIALLSQIEREQLEDDQSLIVNIEFYSRQEFEYFAPDINSIFDKVREWGADPSRDYMVSGPSMIFKDKHGGYGTFIIYSDDKRYVEGFRMCCFQSDEISNGGTLQYSAPSIERILEVMGEIIKLPDVVKSVKSIVYMAVDKLSETSKKGRMDHFDQYKPEIHGKAKESNGKFPLSDEVVEFFRSRGWNLYEVRPEHESRPDLFIPTGAVDTVTFNRSYAVLPACSPSSHFERVMSLMYHAQETNQLPTMRLSQHEVSVLDFITFHRDAVRITFMDTLQVKVPYFNLKSSLSLMSSYVGPNTPKGDGMH
ncbi:hypothetical protein CMO93_02005 [Candidatus Woesearchaeota archaeon]|nr:hypothetical protein [Candidatus Woesearchaeota archaeon]|tara:strand:+ start:3050 stop:3991 length:942 start_codon:yes stop_codon:yes gene_type:complete